MKKQSKNITIITSCALMLFGFIARPQITVADEISVLGNGANSSNTVNVTTAQHTNTQQSNNSQVTNNTNTTASTGNNTANNNSGTTAIKTGDANATTSVNTTANISTLSSGCCNTQAGSALITGNGDGSHNSVNISSADQTTVSINQNANSTNNVSQVAVTGHNTVNNNNSDVTITTGNSTANLSVTNGPVNVANVIVPESANGSFEIKIAGNGANSVNTINENENNTTEITLTNCVTVINNLKTKYITGENSANKNAGKVNIVTGNVLANVSVENAPINVSQIEVKQKSHQKPTPSPTPSPQPSNNAPSSSSSSSSPSNNTSPGSSGSTSGGPGSVMGASTNSLPVTGGNYWFFIALIGNILMMLLGGYLRLRSGRSPGVAVSI